MAKSLIKRALLGFLVGIALNYIVAIATSHILRLGYFMPCVVTLPEMVGGEMKAVVIQALACGLLGIGVAMATVFARVEPWKPWKRRIAAALSIIVLAIPLCVLGIMLFAQSPF